MSNPEFPGPGGQSGSILPPKVEQTLRQDADAVIETAKTEFDKVKDEATAQAGDLVEGAKAQIADVTEKAKDFASQQKDLIGDQLTGVADALQRVAKDLESENGSSAGYARMMADGASRISSTIRDNDVDAIVAMAQDFGRKQPAAFVGAAALLGFAASRFLLASGKRELERRNLADTSSSVDYNGTPTFGERNAEGYFDVNSDNGRT